MIPIKDCFNIYEDRPFTSMKAITHAGTSQMNDTIKLQWDVSIAKRLLNRK